MRTGRVDLHHTSTMPPRDHAGRGFAHMRRKDVEQLMKTHVRLLPKGSVGVAPTCLHSPDAAMQYHHSDSQVSPQGGHLIEMVVCPEGQ